MISEDKHCLFTSDALVHGLVSKVVSEDSLEEEVVLW